MKFSIKISFITDIFVVFIGIIEGTITVCESKKFCNKSTPYVIMNGLRLNKYSGYWSKQDFSNGFLAF